MIYTTKALKGNLELYTIDQVGHEVRPGFVVILPKDGHLFSRKNEKQYLVCKVFKNGKVMVRQLTAEYTPQGQFFTLSAAFSVTPQAIVFSRTKA